MKDTVGAYLEQVGRIPRIDVATERALSERILAGRDGDASTKADAAAALEMLVVANLRLVVSVARRYPTNTRTDLADLIQAGNDGLVKAAERFDGAKGFRFSTYAMRWICQTISRSLDKTASAAYMPIDTSFRVRSSLRSVAGVGEALPAELRELERAYNAASLDQVVGDGGTTLGHLQPDRGEDTEALVLRREECRQAHLLIGRLPVPHRRAIVMRFGFDGTPERSHREIAESLGVRPPDVARLLKEAMTMLRAELRRDAFAGHG